MADNKPRISVSGPPEALRVTVDVPDANVGDRVTFTAGPRDDAKRGVVSENGKPIAAIVEADGVARGILNMSGGSSDATHICAFFHKHSDPVPIQEAHEENALPEIEVVNPPRDPDPTTGLFVVTVVTRKDGNKANRAFTVFSNRTHTIMQSTDAGLVPVSTFTAIEVGVYKLYISFDGVMAKFVFKLDKGSEAIVHLRK